MPQAYGVVHLSRLRVFAPRSLPHPMHPPAASRSPPPSFSGLFPAGSPAAHNADVALIACELRSRRLLAQPNRGFNKMLVIQMFQVKHLPRLYSDAE